MSVVKRQPPRDPDNERREKQRVKTLMDTMPNAIFVFGTNYDGVHGAGAARAAAGLYGAKRGVSFGRQGRSYGIPTKAKWSDATGISLHDIRAYVQKFLDYANGHPDLVFAVTRIGCGYAGYTDEDIAPFFKNAPLNCDLPEGWRAINGEDI